MNLEPWMALAAPLLAAVGAVLKHVFDLTLGLRKANVAKLRAATAQAGSDAASALAATDVLIKRLNEESRSVRVELAECKKGHEDTEKKNYDLRHELEELRASFNEIRAFAETRIPASIVTNGDGVITEWNQGATLMFHWSAADAIGQRSSDLIIPHRYRMRHNQGLQRIRSGQPPKIAGTSTHDAVRYDAWGLTKEGNEIAITIMVEAWQDAEAWFFGATLVRRDVTVEDVLADKTGRINIVTPPVGRMYSPATYDAVRPNAIHPKKSDG